MGCIISFCSVAMYTVYITLPIIICPAIMLVAQVPKLIIRLQPILVITRDSGKLAN